MCIYSNEEAIRLELYIDVRGGVPIYDQIYTQLKAHILRGTLAEDEALPSIRGLAKDLRVSVITTKRAYEELERDGLIYTVAGKGCFVSQPDPAAWREEHITRLQAKLTEARELAEACGLTEAEVMELYRHVGKEEQ